MSICELCQQCYLGPPPAKRSRHYQTPLIEVTQLQQYEADQAISVMMIPTIPAEACTLVTPELQGTAFNPVKRQRQCPVKGCEGILEKSTHELPLQHYQPGAPQRRGHPLYICSNHSKDHQFSRCLTKGCSEKLLRWEKTTLSKKNLNKFILNCKGCCYEAALLPCDDPLGNAEHETTHTYRAGAKCTRLRCRVNASAGCDGKVVAVFRVRLRRDAGVHKDPDGTYQTKLISTLAELFPVEVGQNLGFMINISTNNKHWKKQTGTVVSITEQFYDVEYRKKNICSDQIIRTTQRFWSRHPKCKSDVIKLYVRGGSGDCCPGCKKQCHKRCRV